MGQTLKLASVALTAAALAASSPSAWSLQTVEGSDGVTVEGILSLKEPTRIRIDGAAIVNVFGNIYSSNCAPAPAGGGGAPTTPQINPSGEIVLECDADKGEIYVRPVGGSLKPVNLFVSSATATYTLLLRKSDTPADTIVIRDKAPRQAKASPSTSERTPVHVRALKSMLVAMASDSVPTDIRVDEVSRPMLLWKEANFLLTRIYEGRGLVGERYVLTNISNDNMVVAEQEFDRDGAGVLAVSVETHNLRPGDRTIVYVIRTGS